MIMQTDKIFRRSLEKNYKERSEKNSLGFILSIDRKVLPRDISEKDPLVSVIIPAYNSENTITDTIRSVLDQSYSNFEIIVVDDGSTDNTVEQCKKFGNKIRIITKKNGGTASALNVGINSMTSEWFKWLSSDDLLTSDALKSLMEMIQKTGGYIVYSDYEVIDEIGNHVQDFIEPTYNDYYELASKLWIRYIGNASSIIIHKSCFGEVGLFNENLRFGEDYDWLQRACLVYRYRFFHLKRRIMKYRIHSRQLTKKVQYMSFKNDQKIRERTKKMILESDPEWWKTLEYYRKVYNKMDHKTKVKQILRKILRRMPLYIENRVVAWRLKNTRKTLL